MKCRLLAPRPAPSQPSAASQPTYLFMIAVLLMAVLAAPATGCSTGTGASTDSSYSSSSSSSSSSGSRCADLVLFPVGSVDPADQYRFDYSDVGFGTTHARGASVTVSCTSNGQSAQVYAFDSSRSSITSGSSVLAVCSDTSGRSAWTVNSRTLQFVDCRLF